MQNEIYAAGFERRTWCRSSRSDFNFGGAGD